MDLRLLILSIALAGLLIFASFYATKTAEQKSHAVKLAERNEQATQPGKPGRPNASQSWMNEILSR